MHSYTLKSFRMFPYYGSKSIIARIYPKPVHGLIIEPFAGSARYSLQYFDRDVILIDKYETVVRIWKWLQQCSEGDILGLPKLKLGDDIRLLNVSEDEKLFLGMLAGVSGTSPRFKVSPFAAIQNGRKNQLRRIAGQLFKIKHWKVEHGDFQDIENREATWFIDPPYQFGGNGYVCSKIDFHFLANWAKCRQGQVIVCENTKADWMPFSPMVKMRGAMSTTTEAIWTNLPTSYQTTQGSLFSDCV